MDSICTKFYFDARVLEHVTIRNYALSNFILPSAIFVTLQYMYEREVHKLQI